MSRKPSGILLDPAFRHRRAVNAANARTSPDYYIEKLADAAGRLTADQRARLAAIARPAGGGR